MGWFDTKDKVMTESSTFALVSSLICTLVIPIFIVPPDFGGMNEEGIGISSETLQDLYGISIWLSGITGIAALCNSITILCSLNLCLDEDHIRNWITYYFWMPNISVTLFIVSVISLAFGSWCVLATRYKSGIVIYGSVGACIIVVYCLFMNTFIIAFSILPKLKEKNQFLNKVGKEIWARSSEKNVQLQRRKQ
jgi:hypothetical protein